MAQTPGITPQGFVGLMQSEIIEQLNQAFAAAYGSNVDVSSDNLFGQLIGILSEREALEWQAMSQVAVSWHPNGAQGIYVDNLGTLFGLTRQTAKPTITNPSPLVLADGTTRYGLVVYGDAGTLVEQGSQISDRGTPANVFAIDANIVIAPGSSAVQTLVFSNAPNSGSYRLTLVGADGQTYKTDAIPYTALDNVTRVGWSSTPPSTGSFQLKIAGQTTGNISVASDAAGVQAAINALQDFASVTVSGTAATDFLIKFPGGLLPTVEVVGGSGARVITSVQGYLNALKNSATQTTPFAGLVVQGSGRTLSLSYNEQRPVPLAVVTDNTLLTGNQVVNISAVNTIAGAPAQGVGSATCLTPGPISLLAGSLTSIVTPISGWTGVTNQLDCITGQNRESDASYVSRILASRSSLGTGSLAAVVGKVQQLAGVSQALAFENRTNAADQNLRFDGTPTTGSFSLILGTTPTAQIAYNASALTVQRAIQAIDGYERAQVTGSAAYGYNVSFNGSQGGQSQELITTNSNTTGVALVGSYARPPHSIEVVVEGGSDFAIAQTILQSVSAGIGTYGAPVATSTANISAGSLSMTVADATNVIAGQSIIMRGIPIGTTVVSVSGNTLTMSQASLSNYSSEKVTFSWSAYVKDTLGNAQLIGFSRPAQVPIYVTLSLVTDIYLTPGDPTSGKNPSSAFNPASVATVEAEILEAINDVPIGGLVAGFGSGGIIGSFRDVPGVVDYTATFGPSPNPTTLTPVRMLSNQVPTAQSTNLLLSYT